MKLASLLDPDLIKIHIKAETKKDAIEMLADAVCGKYRHELDKDTVLEKLFKREEEASTFMGKGMLMPHCRIEGLDDVIIAIAIPEKPIRDNGNEIELIIMTIVSSSKVTMYLKILAAFSSAAGNDDLLSSMRKSEHPANLINALSKSDIMIKKTIQVKDIMNIEFVSLKEDDTIRHALDLFVDRNIHYAPVLNGKGEFTGEINVQSILKHSIPEYTEMISNLKFMNSLEPLERLLEQEDKILVREVMEKPRNEVSPEMSVIDMLMHFRREGCRNYPVVESGKLVGIVNCRQIINNILRI